MLVPILEDVVGWDAGRIRRAFDADGLVVREWDKARTDWLTIRDHPAASLEVPAEGMQRNR